MEERLLVFAPRGRDAQVIVQVLSRLDLPCHTCNTLEALVVELKAGAAAVVITEEALAQAETATGDLGELGIWLSEQPTWSDLAFIVLVTHRSGRRSLDAATRLERLGNTVLLERPLNAETLLSASQSALRGRRRQYQARNKLLELAQAEEELQRLNNALEEGIAERTSELQQANERLRSEIAERRRAEEAVVQMQKMEAIGHLTGGIAHDFNNLLTAIVGNVEMIQRRSTDERIRRMAGYARDAVDRATRLTGQLLAFSRSQQLDLRPVAIDRLVAGMEDLLARSIGHSVQRQTLLNAGEASANADSNQLELAILNLAINARDAMPDGGVLTITTRQEDAAIGSDLEPGAYVVISVADTGSGIPPALLNKVFDPFFTTKPIGRGTGLGLSQVYGIARQSGGIARVRNGAPGTGEPSGANIEIWLPVVQAGIQEHADPDRHTVFVQGHGERILVIDDDADVRRTIVSSLDGLGYTVTEAEHGEAGLSRLDADAPQIMIVDFAMPGPDGSVIAARAKALCQDLRVILVTGYADAGAIETLRDTDMVLRKPFALADLSDAVQKCLHPEPSRV